MTTSGDKRGLWHDFQTGEGGHLLGLIAIQSNLDLQRDFPKVLEEAARLLGSSPVDISLQQPASMMATQPLKMAIEGAKKLMPEQQNNLRYARQLARGKPAGGGYCGRAIFIRTSRDYSVGIFRTVFDFTLAFIRAAMKVAIQLYWWWLKTAPIKCRLCKPFF